MNLFIGADHRGYELKNKLVEYLQEQNIRVEDMGNYHYDALDDAPLFAQKVAQAVQQNPKEHMGIVICGSGVAVSVAANRYANIICALGFTEDQVESVRQHDHINMLALPSDYIDLEKAKELVNIFLSTSVLNQEKYLRRLQQIEDCCKESRNN